MGRAVAIAALVCALGAAAGARAQQPAQEARYAQLINEAVGEFDAGRWEEALALFRAAHEVIPNARTLRGIGMAAFELRQYVDARRALEQALTDTRRALTPEQRRHVQGLLDRARTFTGRFRVRATPPDARVTIDGASPTLEPDGSLLLAIGSHEVAASMAGYRAARRPIAVRGGEDEELLMPLEVDASAGAGEPDQGGGSSIEDLLDRRDRRRGRAPSGGGPSGFGIALTVGGGALIVGGLVTGILLVRNQSELEKCRDRLDGVDGEFCGNEPALHTNRDVTAGLTIGLGVAGLASLTTGIILIVTSGGRQPEPRAGGLRCAPSLGGVTCAGRF